MGQIDTVKSDTKIPVEWHDQKVNGENFKNRRRYYKSFSSIKGNDLFRKMECYSKKWQKKKRKIFNFIYEIRLKLTEFTFRSKL